MFQNGEQKGLAHSSALELGLGIYGFDTKPILGPRSSVKVIPIGLQAITGHPRMVIVGEI